MNIPENLFYTKDHEWLRVEGETGFIGITEFAAGEMGDVVFVELPEEGSKFQKGEAFGSIEAVKTVSDIYMPVSGVIIEINENLEGAPETVNSDPFGKGFIVKIKITDPSEIDQLLKSDQYAELIG